MASTWKLVNDRVSAHRDLERDQAHIWRLGRAINASLKEDKLRRTEESFKEVERFLGVGLPSTGNHGTV